jgi:hypothetical protein
MCAYRIYCSGIHCDNVHCMESRPCCFLHQYPWHACFLAEWSVFPPFAPSSTSSQTTTIEILVRICLCLSATCTVLKSKYCRLRPMEDRIQSYLAQDTCSSNLLHNLFIYVPLFSSLFVSFCRFRMFKSWKLTTMCVREAHCSKITQITRLWTVAWSRLLCECLYFKLATLRFYERVCLPFS